MTKSPATCWNAGRFTGVMLRANAWVRQSTRQCCRGVERIRVSRCAATFFPLAASYRFCGDYGGSKWSSARPEARGGDVGRWEREEGTKERERVVGKAADECVFIPGEGPGWQMSSGW
jgi:hypothetical protein